MEFFQVSIGVKERMQHLRIILIFKTIILLRHLCIAELGPFLSKEKAASYLQEQSKRLKRGINEECAEAKGCSYEEIREIGVTDVCSWMKNRLCSQLYCSSEYVCVTTDENCSNLNYYRVGCQVIHCPLDVISGNISSSCRGLIGEKCDVICDNSVNPVNIVCLSSGSWDKDTTDICSLKNESVIHCPLDVIIGYISSSCQGLIGEKCYLICDNSVNTVYIVCLSSGSWDKDTTAICSLKNESESSSLDASRANMTFLYAGTSVAGTLVVVIIIAGVTCLIKRRDDTTRNINQGMPSNTENRTYFESVNSAYEEPSEHVYCEI